MPSKVEIFGPIDPELQEHDPVFGGFSEVATGPQKAMEALGRKLKKAHPERRYRITDINSWVTWRSE